MHVIAHVGCTNTVREFAMKADPGSLLYQSPNVHFIFPFFFFFFLKALLKYYRQVAWPNCFHRFTKISPERLFFIAQLNHSLGPIKSQIQEWPGIYVLLRQTAADDLDREIARYFNVMNLKVPEDILAKWLKLFEKRTLRVNLNHCQHVNAEIGRPAACTDCPRTSTPTTSFCQQRTPTTSFCQQRTTTSFCQQRTPTTSICQPRTPTTSFCQQRTPTLILQRTNTHNFSPQTHSGKNDQRQECSPLETTAGVLHQTYIYIYIIFGYTCMNFVSQNDFTFTFFVSRPPGVTE